MSNPTAKAKILYVDDDPLMCKFVFLALDRQGLQVRTASNGAEGVEMAMEWLPDLILMDLMMPIIDGFQATEALRSAPRTQQIPIVAFTADYQANTHAKALAAGMNGVITKAYPVDDLVRALLAYLP
jgi:CheY-like chemotaxis protein